MIQGILLIVEDEPDLSEILVEMLAPICKEIYTAPQGKEALDILSLNRGIHAILSDINMPQMTGFQLLAELRSAGNHIPFLTLTAYGDQENMRESIRLDATDFLTKPFERKELIDVVSKALIYGIELEKVQKSIQNLYASTELSSGDIDKLNEFHRLKMSLRIENSKYIKKSIQSK